MHSHRSEQCIDFLKNWKLKGKGQVLQRCYLLYYSKIFFLYESQTLLLINYQFLKNRGLATKTNTKELIL